MKFRESLNKKPEKDPFTEEVESLFARLDGLPEEEQWKELEKIKEEYGFEEKKTNPILEKVEAFAHKYSKWAFPMILGAISYVKFSNIINFGNKDKAEASIEKEEVKDDPQYIEDTTIFMPTSIDTAKANPVNRWSEALIETLPAKGKDVYKAMALLDPTPGRYYSFIDKDNALQYIFNEKNELIGKIVVGYGKDAGDAQNTSVELGYNKGAMTTPAGVYLLSSAAKPEDIAEYGQLRMALFGISVLGDSVFLGEHQTYTKHNQLEVRTAKDNSPSPEDNAYSNGCINTSSENYMKYIKPYFKGDGSELTFILPDQKSRESGVGFDPLVLLKKIMPIMIKMDDKELLIYNDNLSRARAMANREAQLLQDLALEHKRLRDLYQENKQDMLTEKQIVKVKEMIKNRKDNLGQIRSKIAEIEKRVEEILIKRERAEQIRDQDGY